MRDAMSNAETGRMKTQSGHRIRFRTAAPNEKNRPGRNNSSLPLVWQSYDWQDILAFLLNHNCAFFILYPCTSHKSWETFKVGTDICHSTLCSSGHQNVSCTYTTLLNCFCFNQEFPLTRSETLFSSLYMSKALSCVGDAYDSFIVSPTQVLSHSSKSSLEFLAAIRQHPPAFLVHCS